MSSITQARLIIGGLVASAVLFPSLYQPLISGVYEYLRTSSAYRSSTFETFWTVFCYAAIEVPMTVAFFKHPQWRLAHPSSSDDQHSEIPKQDHSHRPETPSPLSQSSMTPPPPKPKGMKRPSRRIGEILTYIAPLILLDLTMIKKFADVPLEDMLLSGNYDPHQVLAPQASISTTKSSHFLLPSVHYFTWSSPLQTRRALPLEAPSSRRIVLELAVALFVYDFTFFLFHWALHSLPIVSRWHAPHHKHGEMNPQITNQLSIFERLGLVLLANFSLNIIKSHVLTRTLFVPMFVWLLVELHCGLDVPWGLDKLLPAGWAGGPRKHALHHETGKGGFEPYFCWWDGLLDKVDAKRAELSRKPNPART